MEDIRYIVKIFEGFTPIKQYVEKELYYANLIADAMEGFGYDTVIREVKVG